MIKLAATSLDDVKPEIRAYCKETEDGIVLDTSSFKTQADVDAVLESKRKEVNDHSATKQKLAAWLKLGESPDKVQQKIIDLESRSGSDTELSEKVAGLLRDKRKLTEDLSIVRTELDAIKPEYEKQKKTLLERKTYDVLESCVQKIKGVDTAKLNQTLKKDVLLGIISLDESGEGLSVKTGETFEKYAAAQADIFDFRLRNNPGITKNFDDSMRPSNTGISLPGNLVDLDVAEKLDS